MAGKHGWNTLDDYLRVMLRAVQDDPFVVRHTLEIQLSPEAGEVSGDIVCHDNIILDVTKHFEIRTEGRRKEARTVRYAYHARHAGGDDILRYDNAHRYVGHASSHHKHEFYSTGEKISHVGNEWPHLGEVINELRKMVWE